MTNMAVNPQNRRARTMTLPIALAMALLLVPHLLRGQTPPSVAPVAARTAAQPALQSHDAHPTVTTAYGRLPLAFEANLGQADRRAQFLARGLGYTLLLTGPDATLRLLRPNGQTDDALQFRLVGAKRAAARGDNRLESVTNYYIGNDPQHWHTNVPNFSEVTYEDIYPGVGLCYYGKQGALENDLVIAPGADPGQIRLAIDGARSVRLDDVGNLVIEIVPGAAKATERHVLLGRPEIYQLVGGKRRKVAGGFVMLAAEEGVGEQAHHREIGFTLGDYDHTQTLVIDPTLSYSYAATGGYSVLYGAMSTQNGPTLNVDSAGEAVLVGVTLNSVLQTTANATQTTCAAGTPQGNTTCDGQSIYIEKFNATGTALTFATYFGGATENGIREVGPESTAIGTLDANDNIYVTGQTNAIDFPTEGPSGALQTTVSGNYLCKFYGSGPSAGQLEYSTYLGASDMIIYAVAADSSGNAYVGGTDNTGDDDFPISQNAPPLLCPTNTTCQDGFILGVEPDGGGYMYGTYVGGSQGPMRNGILAASASVQALASYSTGGTYLAVGGLTSFTDMPLTTASYAQAVQTSGSGYVALLDLENTGTDQYLYATYLGGPGAGITAVGLAPGPGTNNLNLYAGGQDDPESSPLVLAVTPGAFEPLPDYGFPEINGSGPGNAYLASFSIASSGQVTTNYVSYLGGSTDYGTTINAITGDSYGDTWVAGTNSSGDFPLLNPLPVLGDCGSINSCTQIGFVTEVNPNGTALLFSTFLGGNTDEVVSGLTLDSSGNVYVGGWTQSPNFPVTSGSPQSSCGTGNCVTTWFVTKLAPQQVPAGPILTFTLNGSTGSSVPVGGTINFPPTFNSFTQNQVITLNNTASSGANLAVAAARAAYTYIAPSIYYNDYTVYPYEAGSTTGDLPCMTISLTPVSISPTASCDMTLSWTPQGGGGPESSLFEVFDNAANISSPQYFYLNGTAVNGSGASLTPSLLSFGNVLLGSTLTENFTITSTGNQALDFNTPTFSLSGSSDFSISSTTCGTSLGAAYSYTYAPYSCTVSISYSAQGNGGVPENAQLSVSDNSAIPPSPQSAQVTATTVYPEPQLVLVPASVVSGIAFPATAQGLPSGTTSFRIENEGNATLQFIVPIIVSGGNSADFHESDTCGANNPLPVYQNCVVSIYFQPSQPGGTTESTTLIIATNDPTTSTLDINLSGTSAMPPGPPPFLPVLTSVDNSVPPAQSTISAGLPAVSSGGQYVAFFAPSGYGSGSSSNLPYQAPSGSNGLYVRNTCAGPNAAANCTQSTQFIAYNPSGAACYFTVYDSPGANLPPAISSDGRFVAFNDYTCFASSNDLPAIADIFLRDTQGQTTTQIADQGGTPIAGGFSMSANAESFGFASNTEAVDRTSGDESWQAYLNITGFSYGIATGTPATLLVSQDNNGNEDGIYTDDGLELEPPVVSSDGRFAAFASPWNDLTGGGLAVSDSYFDQLYLRDTCAGAPQGTPCTAKTILISSPDNLGTFASGGSSGASYFLGGASLFNIAVSAGGRYVAFASEATNLPQPANGNGTYPFEIYLRDTCQIYGQPVSGCAGGGSGAANPGTTILLSSALGGTTPSDDSFFPQISADGRIISFVSYAQLAANAPEPALYAYDTCLSYGQPVTSTPACSPGLLGVISTLSSGQTAISGAALDGTGQFAAYATSGSTSEVWLNATGAPVVPSAPTITFSPARLNFNSVAEGTQSQVQTVTVTNTGNANLLLGTVSISGTNAADFSLIGNLCASQTIGWVAPNNTCTVGVAFTPSLTTSESASLSFADNASGGPQSVGLSGTGTTGVTQATVPNVVGETEATATSAITNGGLSVGTVTIESSSTVPAGEVISESPAAGTLVSPGSTVSLNISSGPPDQENITVTDTDWLTPVINVVAPVVYFSAGPTVGFSGAGATQTLTVSDIGLRPLAVGSSIVSGQGAAQFSVTLLNCSNSATSLATTLPSGGACAFLITYTPSANTANDNATLTFTDSAALTNLSTTGTSPNYMQSIALSGSGTSSTVPPSTVTVPNVVGDTESAAMSSITAANLMVGTVIIASSSTVPAGEVISESPGAETVVSLGSAVNLTVSSGPPDAEIISVSDQSLILVPITINFGEVPINSTSDAQTVTLNNVGSAALAISGISAAGNFSVQTSTTTCGNSLSGNANCSISLAFAPKGQGAVSGTLNVLIPGNPQTVTLTGTGVTFRSGPIPLPPLPSPPGTIANPGEPSSPPVSGGGGASPKAGPGRQVLPSHLALSPFAPVTVTVAPVARFSSSTIVFPAQALGAISDAQTITLTNSSGAPLVISGIGVSEDFSQTNNCGESLAAGNSCTISVKFKPNVAGTYTGTLSINAGAPGSALTIKLSGTVKPADP